MNNIIIKFKTLKFICGIPIPVVKNGLSINGTC